MSKIFTKPFRPLDWAATPHDFSGDNQLGPYAIEEIQRYIYGTRYLMWDGRVYKYSNAVVRCVSYHGARATEAAALGYTAPPNSSSVVGDRYITAAGTLGRSEDDLAGGYVQLYDGADIDTTCLRGIVGNEASVGVDTRIYLAYPLQAPMTTSDALEIYENPYRELSEVSNSYSAWMGVPATTAAAGYKFWLQTFGPAQISPTNATLDDPAANERMVKWDANAGISEMGTANINQIAGFILNQGTGDIAGPLIMLWCSV